MQLDLTIIIYVLSYVLFAIGLMGVEKKLHRKDLRNVWIPGLRYMALGDCVGMNREGVICGFLDLVGFISYVADYLVPEGRVQIAVGLGLLVLHVFQILYRIRIFVKIMDIFALHKKRWIVLWVLIDWLALMQIGYRKSIRPRKGVQLDEGWKAGTAPAQIPGVYTDVYSMPEDGLSVDLRDRTVSDYGKTRYLLKDIRLHIPNKSLVLLLGGSGSGKTTLINALIGYEKANADVLLNGSDVYEDYDSVKYRIGYVPQKNLIRGKDTVYKTISDAARLRLPTSVSHDELVRRVNEVMDLLGLTAGKDGLVEKKSGGQLRRISIAMELASNPELFVLDEPDSGLDGVIARELFENLRQVADEGRIVIVISHTPDRIVDLFDKVIVLARDSGRVGRLAFYGTPDEARAFFGKDTMEGIVMSVNSTDMGGEGRANELIERFAALTSQGNGGGAAEAAEEAAAEASPEGAPGDAPEVSAEAGPEGAPGAAPEASAEAGPEVSPEAATEASLEAGPEVSPGPAPENPREGGAAS